MLRDIVKTISGTPEEVFAYLSEAVTVPNTRSYNGGNLEELLGMQATETILAKIESSPSRLVRLSLFALGTKDGVTLHDKLDLINSLGLSSDLQQDLIALAQETKSRFSSLGGSGELTLDDVTLAIDKNTLEDTAINALQSYREALTVWDGDPSTRPVLGGS